MIAEPLRRFLDSRQVRYRVRGSASGGIATETSPPGPVHGPELARVVRVRVLDRPPGRLVLVAVPAHADLDLAALHRQLGFPVELAPESAVASVFPGCAPDAVPPIGELAMEHVPVYVDRSFGHEDGRIAFPAGTGTDLVEMPWSEYERVAAHRLLDCARARAPHTTAERRG
jgi:prolyl-tRNA editing enzyme YbaK/EbsC (Cys-tRNA(Pro) deacylase)